MTEEDLTQPKERVSFAERNPARAAEIGTKHDLYHGIVSVDSLPSGEYYRASLAEQTSLSLATSLDIERMAFWKSDTVQQLIDQHPELSKNDLRILESLKASLIYHKYNRLKEKDIQVVEGKLFLNGMHIKEKTKGNTYDNVAEEGQVCDEYKDFIRLVEFAERLLGREIGDINQIIEQCINGTYTSGINESFGISFGGETDSYRLVRNDKRINLFLEEMKEALSLNGDFPLFVVPTGIVSCHFGSGPHFNWERGNRISFALDIVRLEDKKLE